MSRIFKSKYIPGVKCDPAIENRGRHVYPSQVLRGGCNQFSRISLVVSLDQTLRQVACALEQQLGISLQHCQFYLQDRVQLKGDWPLSAHCVQLNGLVQLLLEIKSMPTHGSPNGLTRLNVVDIRLPNGDSNEFLETSFSNTKLKPNGSPSHPSQSLRLNPAPLASSGANGIESNTNTTSCDAPSNMSTLPTSQESMYVSPSAVFEAFSIASRAVSAGERVVASNPVQTPIASSLEQFPSGNYSTSRGTSTPYPSTTGSYHNAQYGSNYSMMMERLAGGSELTCGTGGKWTVDKHYRRLMEMNNIPRDPGKWNATQVSHWLRAILWQVSLPCSDYGVVSIGMPR
ncbi:unnamed protein product [Mesocestoides corti]|uniref:GA-binding protein alpha subunit N-terminal domain-containing protein n=1 Tax=Mesocestoides corti TaxID=53468 RepID=A0A0R3UIE1_MESCO|nr:unnamed protein product [Mesocestoides corti]